MLHVFVFCSHILELGVSVEKCPGRSGERVKSQHELCHDTFHKEQAEARLSDSVI